MALKRLPQRIFKDTMTLSVPTGFDRYQAALSPTVYTVTGVHVQAENSTRKSAVNSEVTLRGRVWCYPPYSQPDLDYEALQEAAQAAGGVMSCTITNRNGSATGPYDVILVDGFPDDEDRLHHWELGLV